MTRKRTYRTSKRPSRILKMIRNHNTWISRDGGEYVAVNEIIPFKRFYGSYMIRFTSLFQPYDSSSREHSYYRPTRYFWDKYRPLTEEESDALWDKLFAMPESEKLFADMKQRVKEFHNDDTR